jgi:hypothetical protein
MRRFPVHLLIARLILALALIAPHGARAEMSAGRGLTLVICGGAGFYEISLDGEAPTPPHAAAHDCCLSCASGFVGTETAASHAAGAGKGCRIPIVTAPGAARSHPAGRPRDPPAAL